MCQQMGAKVGNGVAVSVMWQNPRDRYCKKADLVNMKDDQTKSE